MRALEVRQYNGRVLWRKFLVKRPEKVAFWKGLAAARMNGQVYFTEAVEVDV